MVGAMTQTADRCEQASPWSPREAEILAVTLRLLQEHGYDQLTVDAVAGAAHASKATVYRRWPSRPNWCWPPSSRRAPGGRPAEHRHAARRPAGPGETVCEQVGHHASTIRAVMFEVSRHPALNDALQHQFLDQRRPLIEHVLHQAVDRGEISADAISDELWDLLPGYLIFRSIVPTRPPSRRTVQALVDGFLIPGLTAR